MQQPVQVPTTQPILTVSPCAALMQALAICVAAPKPHYYEPMQPCDHIMKVADNACKREGFL